MSTTATTPQVPETKQPEKRLYKSTNKFCNVVTPRGKFIHFKGGMYVTDNIEEIEWLDAAIKNNEFANAIFIDPNARTITAEQENPLLALKKKHIEEYLREQAAMMNPDNDMGTSEPGKLKAASTTSIAPVAAGGDASARLIPVAASLQK